MEQQQQLIAVEEGAVELLVLKWPLSQESSGALAWMLMKRKGGFLMAVPTGFFSSADLQESGDPTHPIGASVVVTVPAVQDGDRGFITMGFDMEVVVVDLQAEALGFVTPYARTDLGDDFIQPFFVDAGTYPDPFALVAKAKEWVYSLGGAMVAFYSAEEEVEVPKTPVMKATTKKAPAEKAKRQSAPQQVAESIKYLAELVPELAVQLSAIKEEQTKMRQDFEAQSLRTPMRPSQAPVSMDLQTLGKVMGPPPRTKNMGLASPPPKKTMTTPKMDSVLPLQELVEEAELEEDPVEKAEGNALALAVLEQSRALTSLVSQMQGGDPLLDSHGQGFSMSSKGAQGREKLQNELGARSGNFMLSVLQNALRRMKPASPLPTSLAQVAETDFSMVSYLERYGGYGNCRELGIIRFALSFVMDAAVRGDLAGVQEHLSLLFVAIEQANQDQGRWDLAFQLLLLDDPPSQMWTYARPGSQASTGRARAFAPLCPQRWATVSLAFLKELDFISNRRFEVNKKLQPKQEDPPVSPKRKGKFPKGKGGGGGDVTGQGAASSSSA